MTVNGTGNVPKNVPTDKTCARKPKRPASTKANAGPPVWGWCVDAHREAGLPDPTPDGQNTAAGKALGKLILSQHLTEAELKDCLALYLADDGKFLSDNGHALSLLPKRLDAYRQKFAESEPPPLSPEAYAELMEIEEEEARKVRANS